MMGLSTSKQLTLLTGTSKPQSNEPLYSNTVIGTLAPSSPLCLRCTKRNSPPISGLCSNFILFYVAV